MTRLVRFFITGLTWVLLIADSQAADWQAVAGLNTGRSQFAAGVVDATIVVFGGVDKDGHYLNSTELLDLANPVTWHQAANNADAISQLTASSVAGQFYSFGGLTSNQQVTDQASSYDPVGDQWHVLANMQTSRELATAIANGNEILLLGGHTNKLNKRYYLNTIETYTPATDTWRAAGKLPMALEAMAAANIDGKIYLFGGLQAGKKLSSAVMRFDPATKKWLRKGFTPVPNPRLFTSGQAAPVLNGKVYLIGGGSIVKGAISATNKVWIYDPVSNTWQSGPDLPLPLMNHAAVATDEAVYVTGGRSRNDLSADNRVWRLVDSWKSQMSSQGSCDLDADGKFSNRDVQLFSQACRNNVAYWPCDLVVDGVFNGKDIAAYKAQWKTAKAACPVIEAVSSKLGLSATSLDFGHVPVGQSAHASVTLTNSGNAAIQINAFNQLAGGFKLSHNCGSSLEISANCTLDFSFSPAAIGKSSAVLSIDSSAPGSPHTIALQGTGIARDDVGIIANAFANQLSDIQVQSTGSVTQILADDVVGDKHQRFILRLSNGQTLLIAHNIDIAPRIASLKVNDSVAFYGEYVWNGQGGLVHWTHHDPAGSHVSGWLKHNGVSYQ